MDDNDGNGPMNNDIDDNCNGTMDDDNNNATDNNVDDNGNGAMDDNISDDNGNPAMGSDRTTDKNINNNGIVWAPAAAAQQKVTQGRGTRQQAMQQRADK